MLTAGEMSQQLKPLNALSEVLGSTPNTHKCSSQPSVTPAPDILTSLLASIDNRHKRVSVIQNTHTGGGG